MLLAGWSNGRVPGLRVLCTRAFIYKRGEVEVTIGVFGRAFGEHETPRKRRSGMQAAISLLTLTALLAAPMSGCSETERKSSADNVAVSVEAAQEPGAEVAQAAPNFEDSYELREYEVAMRDGVKLYTLVIAPRDKSKTYPILLSKSPYGAHPQGPGDVNPLYAKAGYIFVSQDARGRNKSGGEFLRVAPLHSPGQTDAVDASTDTYDTVEWLLKNIPNNNGRVGLKGLSYEGYYAEAGLIDSHPAVKAVSPQAPESDWYFEGLNRNGALMLPMAHEGRKPDGYNYYLNLGPLSNLGPDASSHHASGVAGPWTETAEHPNYDAYWQSRRTLPHLREVRPAVLVVGGWYDVYNLYGSLHVYDAIKKQSPDTAAWLVFGPWWHGQWDPRLNDKGESVGPLNFGRPTSEFFQQKIERPFFEHYLRDGPNPALPAATMFDTGAIEWRTFDAWPPKTAVKKSLYFQAGGRLSFDPQQETPRGFDEYVSDPARPVPYKPGIIPARMDDLYMAEDQRFAATRPDVLVYQSEPLEEDITIAGPISPNLFVSTSGTDSDWVMRLIDVHPEGDLPDREHPDSDPGPLPGFQQMVRGDIMRGKFRNSFEKPEPFVPGEITEVNFTANDALHTFKKGHRIMVQVQSSWFPLFDRNPQKFVDIYKASASDFQKATQRLYYGDKSPSRIELLVLAE